MEKSDVKENAKQAMRELMGYGEGEEASRKREAEVQTGNMPPLEPAKRMPPVSPLAQAESATLISEGTVITGNLTANGFVEIRGELRGNVATSDSIKISGKVLGDIKGTQVDICASKVKGNISAGAALNIDQNSVVVGNVQSEDVTVDGQLKGDIVAENHLILNSNAVVVGDVTARLFHMTEGTRLQGTVKLTCESTVADTVIEELDF